MAVDLEKIQDSPHLLDILLQMEDVLDSLDLYCFKNWFKGEVVEGPAIRRYWLSMTLKYSHKEMPDPRAGLRMLKHGIRVEYEEAKEETKGVVSDDEKAQREDGKHDEKPERTDSIWLVHIDMPRRLVSQIATSEMDFYDDDVDADDFEDAEDAKDAGIDDEGESVENPNDENDTGEGDEPEEGEEAPK